MLRAVYFKGQLCDSRLSYEFFSNPPLKLPLAKVGNELEDAGWPLTIKTAFVLVFNVGGVRVSLYPSGKILVKNVSVEADAKKTFKKVIDKLNELPSIQQV